MRYTQRLTDAGIQASVGSRGDSYDNALAETVNGLYETELIHATRRSTTTPPTESKPCTIKEGRQP